MSNRPRIRTTSPKPARLLLALACALALAPAMAQSPPAQPLPPISTDTPPPDRVPDADTPPPETSPAQPTPEQAAEVASREDLQQLENTLGRIPLDEIRRYVAVFNAVRSAYVEPVSDRDLMHAAIKGLLLGLDPHSVYFEAEDAQAFTEGASGAYGGVGVEVVNLPDGGLRVVAPLDGTPAERAGLRSGDIITAIDGVPLTAGGDAQSPLRGEAGSTVKITVLREGEAAPLEMSMVREVIRITSVRSRMLEPGYGYVRVSQFQADTASDFGKAIASLKQSSGGRLHGVVIDLRSNPGGLLSSAVQIADDLLDSGGIVSTRGRLSSSEAEFKAVPGDLLDGAPVVVVIDAGSASASEVLAGALSDNKRARIIGSRSFGKGSVQTLLPLDNGDSVKLTTARYYTPSGRSIQARGIDPDVVLQADGSSGAAPPRITEAALPGHLHGDEEDGEVGVVLPGQAPIDAALVELKKLVAGQAGS